MNDVVAATYCCVIKPYFGCDNPLHDVVAISLTKSIYEVLLRECHQSILPIE